MIRLLNKQDALNLFQEKIKKDFNNPYPPFEIYQKAIEKEIYKAYIFHEQEIDKAYMILQERGEFLFMPWFAVEKEQRGKGIGSKALLELKKKFLKEILIEVENEKNTQEESKKEIIQKRRKFYQKLGFEKVEQISYVLNAEYYDIMILGNEKDPYKIKTKIEEFYQQVLPNLKNLKIEIQ